MRFFDKVDIGKIVVNLNEKQLVFSCRIEDEKALNIAAGKIHRKVADDGVWELKDDMLHLLVPAEDEYSFEHIKACFNRMLS